jgi:hypothetical protein
MEIEDVVGVKIGIENEVDMEDGNRGWNLEDIAGDSLTLTSPLRCPRQAASRHSRNCSLRSPSPHLTSPVPSTGQRLPQAARCPAPCEPAAYFRPRSPRRWLLPASSWPLRRSFCPQQQVSSRSGVNASARQRQPASKFSLDLPPFFNANALLLFSNVLCLVGLSNSWMKSCCVCCVSLFMDEIMLRLLCKFWLIHCLMFRCFGNIVALDLISISLLKSDSSGITRTRTRIFGYAKCRVFIVSCKFRVTILKTQNFKNPKFSGYPNAPPLRPSTPTMSPFCIIKKRKCLFLHIHDFLDNATDGFPSRAGVWKLWRRAAGKMPVRAEQSGHRWPAGPGRTACAHVRPLSPLSVLRAIMSLHCYGRRLSRLFFSTAIGFLRHIFYYYIFMFLLHSSPLRLQCSTVLFNSHYIHVWPTRVGTNQNF